MSPALRGLFHSASSRRPNLAQPYPRAVAATRIPQEAVMSKAVKLITADPLLTADFIELFVGKRLGWGCYRQVFAAAGGNDLVLKIEPGGPGHFNNAMEWEVWREVRGTEWEKWFAPCIDISPCGKILAMKRTTPIEQFPKDFKIPSFFQDVKPENWGRFKGRLVCHDYAITTLIRANLKRVTMKAAA